jgi:ribosome-associated translation inhibitor RaiA
MLVQVNAGNGIRVQDDVARRIEDTVQDALTHHVDYITRVEVHLSDENRHKGGEDDMRCMMEARIEGRGSIAVNCHAGTLPAAIDGAAEKLEKAVGHELGKARARAAQVPAPQD